MRTMLLSLLCLLCLLACAIDQEPDPPVAQPVNVPVDLSGGQAPSGGTVIGGPQVPVTCTQDSPLFRCVGTTVQQCNLRQGRYEDDELCGVRGERCSTRPQDCFGFVGIACCVSL